MRHVLVLLVVLALAGCNAPPSDPGTGTTTSTSAGPTTTTTGGTTTTTSTTPPTGSVVTLAAGPRPASGPAFEDTLWEEPAPPVASRIRARVAGDWLVRVEGAAGAVPANAQLLVAEGGVARGALVRAGADGSFTTTIMGGPGGQVQVAILQGVPPPAPTLHERIHQTLHALPSTYVRVPADAPVAATGHVVFGAPWRFEGAVTDAGSEVRVTGTLRLRSDTDLAPSFDVRLARAFDGDGAPRADFAYLTTGTTPSGLALERTTRQEDPSRVGGSCTARRTSASTLECDLDVRIPWAGLPAGGYVVMLSVPLPGDPAYEQSPPADYVKTSPRAYEQGASPLAFVPHALTATPRLATLLLVDAPAQVARGVQPEGATWGWSNRIAWQPALHVTPREDARGDAIAYTLEPYLPQVGITDRDAPAPFILDLDPANSSWTVRVRAPDGSESTLGPFAFDQVVTRTATTEGGDVLNNGGGNVNGVPRLARLDGAFRRAFEQDGLHTLVVTGTVRDRAGHAFDVGGTYKILVAEPMDLDLGMLPGTPLEVGEYVDRAIQVHPPVPAHVTYRYRAWTGVDGTLSVDDTTEGNASAFGWFHPHPGHPVRVAAPGEYRVDVTADWTSPDGRLYAATWSMGGVLVDPAAGLDVHGRKGIDQDRQDKARFLRSDLGIPVGGNHFNFPYERGDVAWQTDDDSMEVRITLGDPDGALRARFAQAVRAPLRFEPASPGGPVNQNGDAILLERFAQGQGPLVSGTTTGRDASLGDAFALEAYAYAAVERPGVRVRELVKEDYVPNGYWRFDETYTLQPGVSADGDGTNDYKFLFGGAIVRDHDRGTLRTGGYSSLWIDIPTTDAKGSRVDSPFVGPLFQVRGKDVRAFFDVTGTRAGSLLVEGDIADLGGYVVPLGPHDVHVNVTSPSGKVRPFTSQANAWGFLHDPAMNFVVDEPGVWRVDVKVVACDAARCVEGGLNDGASSYAFYVASAGETPLPIAPPAFLSPGAPLALTVEGLPGGGHASAWMPGWLLEARALAPGDAVVRTSTGALPNAEAHGFRRGIPADQLTLTAVAPTGGGVWRGVALDVWGGRVVG